MLSYPYLTVITAYLGQDTLDFALIESIEKMTLRSFRLIFLGQASCCMTMTGYWLLEDFEASCSSCLTELSLVERRGSCLPPLVLPGQENYASKPDD